VHTSDQPETTWARTAIFSACALYKVLTPEMLRSFTLEEFFHQKMERGEKIEAEKERMSARSLNQQGSLHVLND